MATATRTSSRKRNRKMPSPVQLQLAPSEDLNHPNSSNGNQHAKANAMKVELVFEPKYKSIFDAPVTEEEKRLEYEKVMGYYREEIEKSRLLSGNPIEVRPVRATAAAEGGVRQRRRKQQRVEVIKSEEEGWIYHKKIGEPLVKDETKDNGKVGENQTQESEEDHVQVSEELEDYEVYFDDL